VAVEVGEGAAAAGEVLVLERGLEREVLVALEVRVVALDAGVDDGPDDVVAEGREGDARRVGLHGAERAVDEGLDLEVGPDVVDGPRADAGPDRPVGQLRLGERGVVAHEVADHARLQPREQVLLAELALLLVDALRGGALAAGGDERLRLRNHPLAGALAAAGEFEVEVDDDRVHLRLEALVGAAPVFFALEDVEERDGDDRLVQRLGGEGFLLRVALGQARPRPGLAGRAGSLAAARARGRAAGFFGCHLCRAPKLWRPGRNSGGARGSVGR
jgi:hypothetical protein